jgi:four helix bundle protein
MSKIEKFEDLIAWQKARVLTKEIYGIFKRAGFDRDLGLQGQIQRAAISIMANLAEGFERGRMRGFHQFISVAKSSCAELRSHLYVAADVGYIDGEQFEALKEKAEEISRVLGGLRAAVAKQREGEKF